MPPTLAFLITLALSTPVPATTTLAGLPPTLSGAERDHALDCMALAIVHEAGQEPRAGQEAVAEVILNRLAHPAFPKSVCAVVFAGAARSTGCQFSFVCDGALRRVVAPARLAAARAVAAAVLDGTAPRRVPGATHYHASYVSPRWAPGLVRMTDIGQHIFYRRADAGGAPVPPPLAAGAPTPPVPFAPWGLSGRS